MAATVPSEELCNLGATREHFNALFSDTLDKAKACSQQKLQADFTAMCPFCVSFTPIHVIQIPIYQ